MVCLIKRNSSSHRYFSMIQNPHWLGLSQMTWCSLVRQFPSLGSAQGSHLAQPKIGRPWLSFPVHQSQENKPPTTLNSPTAPSDSQTNTHLQYFTRNTSMPCFNLCPPSGWISVQVLCVWKSSFSISIFTFTPFSLLLSLSFSSRALLPVEAKDTHPSQLAWHEGDSQSLSPWHVDKCVGIWPNI